MIYYFKNQNKTGALSGPCPNYPFRWSKEKNFSIDELSYGGRSLQIREKLDYAQGIDHQIPLALTSYPVKEAATVKESDTANHSIEVNLLVLQNGEHIYISQNRLLSPFRNNRPAARSMRSEISGSLAGMHRTVIRRAVHRWMLKTPIIT